MGDTGEDDVHRSCWNHQVVPAVRSHDAFSLPVLTLCHRPCRIWETTKRTTRQANTEADGAHRPVLFPFLNPCWDLFNIGHIVSCEMLHLRRGNHRPAETDAAQRLRRDGEAVSPSVGMLHSGVSCRSNIFVNSNFPTF